MAWTTPMTFTSGAVLTAAQLNTHLRDNLNETAPAKATTLSGYFVSTGSNAIVERIATFAEVGAAQSTSSATYTNLTTAGPAVTVDTGARALEIITATSQNDTSNSGSFAGIDVTGASTIAPNDARALILDGITGGNILRMSMVHLESNLTPGSNTFTTQYRVSGGTGTWNARHLVVLPY